jgi:lipopolysaccharide transport system ATP-binding protein
MTDQSILLTVDGLAKRFSRSLKHSMIYGLTDMVREVTGVRVPVIELRATEFWALKNISFTLTRGTSLGLVGANGSGKTTLLRIISGLIKPDAGEVAIQGRVAPLIALGAGFNPILSGRENVYVNMAILGLGKKEIEARFDEVLEFAGIGDAIDSPVQTYSSGMAARLGFSCAVHTTPDLLLVDEVLSVGDMRFRSKCYRKLAELKRNGTSFVMVSHNTNAIVSMCDSVLYLEKGAEVMRGSPSDVMAKFEQDLVFVGGQAASGQIFLPPKAAGTSTGVDICRVHFLDATGESLSAPKTGERADFCVDCYARDATSNVSLGIIIRHLSGELEPALSIFSERDKIVYDLPGGQSRIVCRFPSLGLRPGAYSAKISLARNDMEILDAVESFNFEVVPGCFTGGSAYYQPREWSCSTLPAAS